jgi:hypothetical protein
MRAVSSTPSSSSSKKRARPDIRVSAALTASNVSVASAESGAAVANADDSELDAAQLSADDASSSDDRR